jgi:uncharacterized protein YdhG (YjbR/CyaY superfamily)
MDNKTIDNTDDYIAQFPAEIQKVLAKLRETFRKAVPEATEAFAYGIPTFKLNGKNLVHFAAFKGHYGVFPTPDGVEQAKELGMADNVAAKGTLQFPIDQEIPYDKLTELIKVRAKADVYNK